MRESRELIHTTRPDAMEIERPFDSPIVNGNGRYPGYRNAETQDGVQLLDYWRAIRKRIWLVLGITVLATTLAALYMARKPDIFAAHALIQVDQEQANEALSIGDRPRSMNSDPSYINTQLQLLTSEGLLRRVVKEHNLDSNPEFQKAKNDAAISPWRAMLKAVGLAKEEQKKDALLSTSAPTTTLISADEIAEAVRLAPYVELIKKNLRVEPIRDSRVTFKDTRLIEIGYTNQDPLLAAFVTNAIGETFTVQNQEKRSGTSRKTSDFLQTRITELQSQIRADEVKLVELKKSVGILETPGDQTIVLERLAGLNKELLEAENERKNAEAEFFSLRNSPDKLRSLAEAESARYITERENYLVNFRNETEKNLATLRANKARQQQEFHDTAPEILEIDSQIASLENSLKTVVDKNAREIQDFRERVAQNLINNLQTKYGRTKSKEDKIRSAFDQQKAEAEQQNAGAVTLKLLEQNIEANKGFLDKLQEQQSSNDVTAQGSDNNISVAGFAIPNDTPIGPSRLLTVLAALLLSTMFGIGLALFLEYLDDTIRTVEEIESVLQLPALAAIPTIDSLPKRKLLLVGANDAEDRSGNELLINADSRSPLSEAYRQLRTSVLLSTAGHPPKSLLVTSSLPSEGKTTTATNTAISLAQTGAKVLIVDADMRRPRLHSVFGFSNNEGLSTLLSSEYTDSDILRIVKKDESNQLNLLTSGPIPPNPAELIGSEQMANLLKKLQTHFTHVVIDSPPITSFTDGVLIASLVDGVIIVVHSGKSSRQVVKRARQLLSDVGARILGVVLNNVNLRSQDSYHYYQNYYERGDYYSNDN